MIEYLLPSNWLPSEKIQAKAQYSDEKGKDPFDSNIPRVFRFAQLKENNFDSQDNFGYKINWGKNEVRYWVQDSWGNTFEQPPKIY